MVCESSTGGVHGRMILEQTIELRKEHTVCVGIVDCEASTGDLGVQSRKTVLGLEAVRSYSGHEGLPGLHGHPS
jgi:hypothetical protein